MQEPSTIPREFGRYLACDRGIADKLASHKAAGVRQATLMARGAACRS